MGILGYFLVVVTVLEAGAERRGREKREGRRGRRRQKRMKKDRFTFMLGML